MSFAQGLHGTVDILYMCFAGRAGSACMAGAAAAGRLPECAPFERGCQAPGLAPGKLDRGASRSGVSGSQTARVTGFWTADVRPQTAICARQRLGVQRKRTTAAQCPVLRRLSLVGHRGAFWRVSRLAPQRARSGWVECGVVECGGVVGVCVGCGGGRLRPGSGGLTGSSVDARTRQTSGVYGVCQAIMRSIYLLG